MLRRSTTLSDSPTSPHDPALPAGDRLIDVAFLRDGLERFGGTRDDASVVFETIRYKPGARLTVTAALRATDGEVLSRAVFRAFRRGESAPAADKVRSDDTPPSRFVHDAGDEWLAVAYPYDYELPALRRWRPDREFAVYLRRLLPQFVDGSRRLRSKSLSLHLLRLKPGRHAVFRLDGIVRNAETGTKAPVSFAGRICRPAVSPPGDERSWGGVTPRRLAVDEHRGVTIEEWIDGRRLDTDDADWSSVAEALAAFHDDGEGLDRVPALRTSDVRRHVFDLAETVDVLDPALGARARSLAEGALARVERSASRGRIHGDLHPGQLLSTPGGVRIVDLATTRTGPVERDLADLVVAADAAELWSLYATRSRRTLSEEVSMAWGALRLVENAAAPTRNLHPRRHELAHATLASAAHLLDRARWTD